MKKGFTHENAKVASIKDWSYRKFQGWHTNGKGTEKSRDHCSDQGFRHFSDHHPILVQLHYIIPLHVFIGTDGK